MQDISQHHNIIPKTSKIKKMRKKQKTKSKLKLRCENEFNLFFEVKNMFNAK